MEIKKKWIKIIRNRSVLRMMEKSYERNLKEKEKKSGEKEKEGEREREKEREREREREKDRERISEKG